MRFPFIGNSWEGDAIRDLTDVDASVDPEDEFNLEWDSTTELWVPVARLEGEDITISTTNFDGILSATEDTVQEAFDILDDVTLGDLIKTYLKQ